MDCPRCGGTLDAYVLRGNRAVRCEQCGWTGTEADLADVDGAGSTGTWDEALEGVSGRADSVERRETTLPPAAIREGADAEGDPTPHVERVHDTPTPGEGSGDSPEEKSEANVDNSPGGSDADADDSPGGNNANGADDAGGLETIDGVRASEAEQLRAAGIGTVEELAAADRAALVEETGLSWDRIRTFVRRASIQVVTDDSGAE